MKTTVPDHCVLVLGEPAGGGDEVGHVDVVAAGVHHADRLARVVGRRRLAGVGQAGGLGHGQGVEVRADQDGRPLAVLEDADDAELADAGRHLGPGLLQLLGDPSAAVATSL